LLFCAIDVRYSMQGKSAIVRLVHNYNLGVDECLTVYDAKCALVSKLQPKFIW